MKVNLNRINVIGVFVNAYVHHDINDAIKGISKAGFEYVELLSTPGLAKGLLPDPGNIDNNLTERYLKLCEKNNLKIIGLYYYKGGKQFFIREEVLEKFKKLIKVSKIFGAKFITTDTDEVVTPEDEKYFYNYIKEISEYAGLSGIKVCLDIHGNWCKNGIKAAEIANKINHPNLGINYCTGNAIYWGDSRPEDDIKNALPFIFKIHFKDSEGVFQQYNFPALGEGTIDFKKIFQLIKSYGVPIIAEVELNKNKNDLDDINKSLKNSFIYLRDKIIFS